MDQINAQTSELSELIASELGIDIEQVTDSLEYQSITEWDSLAHVRLMLAIEAKTGKPLGDDAVVSLRSVGAIKAFMQQEGDEPPSEPASPAPAADGSGIVIHRGLENVYLDRSEITSIDGNAGVLEFRGYDLNDLAEHATFEEVAYLLLNGELPTRVEYRQFVAELKAARTLPQAVLDTLASLAAHRVHPMDALRTGISALGALQSKGAGEVLADARTAGLSLIAQTPSLIAAYQALRDGRAVVAPDNELGHAENFLYMLTETRPSAEAARILERVLIVQADHGVSAAALAVRVAIGCQACFHASITAAIATFSGSLHGGAAERCVELIDEIGAPEHAKAYVRERQASRLPVVGFGHRVYRVEDPRVRHMRAAAFNLSQQVGNLTGFDTIQAVIREMEPYARYGANPNVDLFSGLIYRLLGLSDDLAVPIFVASRMSGWSAHALEQRKNNVLIRPLLEYVGRRGRRYKAMVER